MSPVPEKFVSTIEESIVHLVSRAANKRGLDANELRPRVMAAVEKYLLRHNENAQAIEVKEFIDEVRSDDLFLIVACERGDEKAWEDLVANFDSTVKSAARKISSNAEDAEDLASSIWAELYGLRLDANGNKKSKLAYYSGRGSLAGWLRWSWHNWLSISFASNRSMCRSRKTANSRILQTRLRRTRIILGRHTSTTRRKIYNDQQTESDVSEALRTAIASLEDEDRLILKLYYFEDRKLKDIAGPLAITKLPRVANWCVCRTILEDQSRDRCGHNMGGATQK